MRGMNTRWCETELDGKEPRKRFRRALMRALAEYRRKKRETSSIFTPYWGSDYIDWLIYEATIQPIGVRVESVEPDIVTFTANCAGVSSEGVCLNATFRIPTACFTRDELKQMIDRDFEYYPVKETPNGLDYGPFTDRKCITELEWWYDNYYDDEEEENE